MANWGEKIPDFDLEALRERLVEESDGKAVKRLVTAIEYKNGQSPAAIEQKYGIPKDTVYTWLDRFEERGLDEALHDDPRPGRERALSEDEWERLQRTLDRPPVTAGYDAATWSTELVREHLRTEFGAEYTRRHVRRLVDEAASTTQNDRRGAERTEPDE